MTNTKLFSITLISLCFMQVGCGKNAIQSKSFTSTGTLGACLLPSDSGCDDIDQKIAEAETSITETDAAMVELSKVDVLSDPSKLLDNKSFNKLVGKIKDLILKLDQLEAKLDLYLGTLDPKLNADLIAKIKKAKERLARIEGDILAARDRLVLKLDVFTVKLQEKINKLDPLVRLILDSKIQKVMKFISDFRTQLIAIGT